MLLVEDVCPLGICRGRVSPSSGDDFVLWGVTNLWNTVLPSWEHGSFGGKTWLEDWGDYLLLGQNILYTFLHILQSYLIDAEGYILKWFMFWSSAKHHLPIHLPELSVVIWRRDHMTATPTLHGNSTLIFLYTYGLKTPSTFAQILVVWEIE